MGGVIAVIYRSWGGHKECVVVGKCFGKGSYRESRNNLLGRRHQPWGHTEDGQLGVLALLTPKSTACPCPPSPSLAGVCAATAALGNPLEQGAEHGQWGAACGEWGTEHRTQGMGCLWVSTAPRNGGFLWSLRCPVHRAALLLSRRELGAAKEQVFWCLFFLIFFIYCFDILTIIFSLIFPPPVSSCVGSYHGEIGLWV